MFPRCLEGCKRSKITEEMERKKVRGKKRKEAGKKNIINQRQKVEMEQIMGEQLG